MTGSDGTPAEHTFLPTSELSQILGVVWFDAESLASVLSIVALSARCVVGSHHDGHRG
jgi:hypothetical protein